MSISFARSRHVPGFLQDVAEIVPPVDSPPRGTQIKPTFLASSLSMACFSNNGILDHGTAGLAMMSIC